MNLLECMNSVFVTVFLSYLYFHACFIVSDEDMMHKKNKITVYSVEGV